MWWIAGLGRRRRGFLTNGYSLYLGVRVLNGLFIKCEQPVERLQHQLGQDVSYEEQDQADIVCSVRSLNRGQLPAAE